MDLQPYTFTCFGIRRIERVRIPSLRIRTLRLLWLALPIYRTNMRTFLLTFSCSRPACSQRIYPQSIHRLFNFWPTARTFSSWARSWGAGSVQPRDRGCPVNAGSYVHALHVERALSCLPWPCYCPSKWRVDRVPYTWYNVGVRGSWEGLAGKQLTIAFNPVACGFNRIFTLRVVPNPIPIKGDTLQFVTLHGFASLPLLVTLAFWGLPPGERFSLATCI